jgi:hypothetical protein
MTAPGRESGAADQEATWGPVRLHRAVIVDRPDSVAKSPVVRV